MLILIPCLVVTPSLPPPHWLLQGGHKVLLFSQTQQMLDIIEKMVGRMGLSYYRHVAVLRVPVGGHWAGSKG